MNIKAITTHYRGYAFRSRLEARWAVFFETLGLKWEYEPEGFELPDGTRYLPDFRLPADFDMWVEIKGREPAWEEAGKLQQLVQARKCWGAMLWGQPGEHTMRLYGAKLACSCGCVGPRHGYLQEGVNTGGETSLLPLLMAGRPSISDVDIYAALRAARSARFEFNQSGPTQ